MLALAIKFKIEGLAKVCISLGVFSFVCFYYRMLHNDFRTVAETFDKLTAVHVSDRSCCLTQRVVELLPSERALSGRRRRR